MNDQQWAYKTKWRVGKAIFFTALIHMALVLSLLLATGADLSDWVPDFLRSTTPNVSEMVDGSPARVKNDIPVP